MTFQDIVFTTFYEKFDLLICKREGGGECLCHNEPVARSTSGQLRLGWTGVIPYRLLHGLAKLL